MLRQYAQGDHVCALYETEKEMLAISARYVAEGLQAGERCLFVAGSPDVLTRFRAALDALGLNSTDQLKRGALVLATNTEAHLAGGCLDSERMLRMLNDAVEDALNAGFQGLRTCGDMSWLIDKPEGSEQVVEYEVLLNQFFRGVRAVGMCLFDHSRLPPVMLDHALASHPSVALERGRVPNPFFEPVMARARQPDQVSRMIRELRQGA